METFPCHGACESDRLPDDACRGPGVDADKIVVRLGESLDSGDAEERSVPESFAPELPRDGDAVTIVLRSPDRVRFVGRLGVPRVVVATLVVLGIGGSVELFGRQGERDDVRHGATMRNGVGAPSARRERRGAGSSDHRRSRIASRHRSGWQEGAGVDRRRGRRRGVRVVSRTPISGMSAGSDRIPSLHSGGGVSRVGVAPEVDDGSARAEAPAWQRRRPPCVPGTLGC